MSSGSGVPIEFIMSVFFLPLRKGKKFFSAAYLMRLIRSYKLLAVILITS